MNRREFSQILGAGAALGAVCATGAAQAAASGKSRARDWGRERFRGFENILMPSFTPDLQSLDEDAIRHDVRLSIAHGCFSVFCPPLALNPAEARQFLQLVVDEAAGRIAVGIGSGGGAMSDRQAFLRDAEKIGVSHALIHPAHDFRPGSDEELYRHYRELIDASGLGVVLWATDGQQFAHLSPNNVVLPVYDRLADHPNVFALKLMTTLDLPTVFACCERLHDRLLIGGVHLGLMPLLVKNYGMQWSGAWTIEALQSPEKRYIVDYLALLRAGRTDQAVDLFWKIKPAYDALFTLMSPMLPKGVHPFTHLKYYQWCVGGNGGLLREATNPFEREFPLRPADRALIARAFRSIGIEPATDQQQFIVGRAAHSRGVSADALTRRYNYVA